MSGWCGRHQRTDCRHGSLKRPTRVTHTAPCTPPPRERGTGIVLLLTPCASCRIVYLPGLEEEDVNVDEIIRDGQIMLQL